MPALAAALVPKVERGRVAAQARIVAGWAAVSFYRQRYQGEAGDDRRAYVHGLSRDVAAE
jgi:hypothetical protein